MLQTASNQESKYLSFVTVEPHVDDKQKYVASHATSGNSGWPQIFIGDKHVGIANDLAFLSRNTTLLKSTKYQGTEE